MEGKSRKLGGGKKVKYIPMERESSSSLQEVTNVGGEECSSTAKGRRDHRKKKAIISFSRRVASERL